ncbi:MAG: tetraacyldisaccharide 4'-kinase [Bacteroidetes bacterium]|nr:tetraacyldisaccharide 4'-kinase [Bacteroidota bacterium]
MKFLLYPLMIIFSIGIRLRHLLYDMGLLKSKSFDVPILCVGNLRVGGTGKTPMVDFLVKHLEGEYNIAVLSRGYKRKSKGFKILKDNSTTSEVGDEPLLQKLLNPNIMVAVCESRCKGVKEILRENPEINLIILDDAMQHRAINPKSTILLTEYGNLYTFDKLMPIGTLRDLKERAKKADIVVITKCPEKVKPIDLRLAMRDLSLKPYQQLLFTKIKTQEPCSLFDNTPLVEADKVMITTAIGMPEKFIDEVKRNYKVEDIHIFRDHHNYSSTDIKTIFEQNEDKDCLHWDTPLLCTAKDAVKIKELNLGEDITRRIYVVNISLEVIDYPQALNEINFINTVKNKLYGEYRRNRKSHKPKN